jgi:hypothetical protein
MKVSYKSNLYIGFLLVLIVSLIFVNISSLINGQLIAILPLLVQLTVIISILTKWKFVKIVVRVYGIILLLAGGLQLLGQLLFLIADAQDKINYDTMLKSLILTAIGLIIFTYCNQTIIISDEEVRE